MRRPTQLLRAAFIENAALKAVAMILAVTLFILVHGERDRVVAVRVKVAYVLPKDRVLMSEPTDEVRVMVKGPWTRVRRFDESDVEAIKIDLTRFAGAEYYLQEDMIRLPPGLQILSINPRSIHLVFQDEVTKVVGVVPVVDGEPAHGYKVERLDATPQRVTVRGAKSAVDATTGVETRRVPVDGKQQSFTVTVPLAPTESHVAVQNAAPVEVAVTIVEQPAEVVLDRIPVQVRPAAGLVLPPPARAPTVDPQVVSIVLRGGKNAVEKVDAAMVVAHVVVHAEDLMPGRTRAARVDVEGIPLTGVAIEVRPREVSLRSGPTR